jgi:tetratricopeptide (TPR) repeat protein
MHTPRRLLTGPRRLGAVLAAAALASAGCQNLSKFKNSAYSTVRSALTSSYHDSQAEAKMARAEELYNKGDFRAAQDVFSDLADNTYNPVLLAEKARFLEAECLRKRQHFTDAVASYNRQLMDFPAGAYRERACTSLFEIAFHEWLEKDTLAEIEAAQAGKLKPWWERARVPNPLDPSRPMFEVESEALKALETVHTHDIGGPNADRALFWCGYVHFYRGRYEEADHFLSQLVEMHKDSKYRPAALEMAIQAKNNSTGGAVYDSQKASEALQLIHHTEATSPDHKSPEKREMLTRQKLAVQVQLAEKDFRMAEYYERTDHPASAYFYYELVCRRYPGTKFSDLARARIGALEAERKKAEQQKANPPPPGTVDLIRQEWDRLTGKPPAAEEDANAPAGPKDAPPRNLPPDIGNPR